MRVTLAAVGKMKSGPERTLADRYLDRFAKAGGGLGLDLRPTVELSESRFSTAAERQRDEAERLGNALPDGGFLCLLDERGRALSSPEFAETLGRLKDRGQRDFAVVIGGPDGHDAALRDRADLLFSLGRVTFPHQIVRILVAEQLYRAATILAGHPYHRS